MKVDVESVGSFQRKVTFLIERPQVEAKLDRAYRNLAKSARIPGFRAGKAPRRVLEAHYGERVEADVANELIQSAWRDIYDKGDLKVVGQPNVTDSGSVADAEGFRFVIDVDVQPEITVETYKGVDVYFPPSDVTEDEISAEVQKRLEGHAHLAEVKDRPVQRGDMAVVELHAFDGDNEVATELGTMVRTEGDPYYPGIEPFLEGLGVGEEKEGSVTFGEDARNEDVAGRELKVKAKVVGLQHYQLPELTDEIATDTLGYEGGIEGMKSALSQGLQDQKQEQARNQARANLLEVLIEKNPFEVPQGMVDRSLDMLQSQLRLMEARSTGRDPKTIGFSDAQVADLRQRSVYAAKAGLILDWVADAESIEISDEDVATTLNQSVEAIRAYPEEQLDDIRGEVRQEKALDWLLEQANILDTPPADATPSEDSSDGE
ncbi:MAG: trigger factor [Myxococcota bacterium]